VKRVAEPALTPDSYSLRRPPSRTSTNVKSFGMCSTAFPCRPSRLFEDLRQRPVFVPLVVTVHLVERVDGRLLARPSRGDPEFIRARKLVSAGFHDGICQTIWVRIAHLMTTGHLNQSEVAETARHSRVPTPFRILWEARVLCCVDVTCRDIQ
jgi:hypothetical protein